MFALIKLATLVLVVSDGAGSASHGQVGANRVADCVSSTFLSVDETLARPFSNQESLLGIVELGILMPAAALPLNKS